MKSEPREFDAAAWAILREAGAYREDPHGHVTTDLLRLIEHYDPDVREQAISILGLRWKSIEIFPKLIHILQTESDESVCIVAVKAVAVFAQNFPNLRVAAVDALTQSRSDLSKNKSNVSKEANLYLGVLDGTISKRELAATNGT